MLISVNSFARAGTGTIPVLVEVDTSPGTPSTIVIGVPKHQARESIRRVENTLTALGYHLPTGRTVVRVLPIDVEKDAVALELPIAVGLLIASGQAKPRVNDSPVVGELSKLSQTV
jgi:magnesium chelatase family protein